MKTIGIIGGMGPLATAHLFEQIVLRTKAQKDQEHIHVLIDNNTNIPDRTKAILGNGDDPTTEMIISAKHLESCGADFLIMPCNTAHFFIDKILSNIGIPMLNMVDETVDYTYEKHGKNAIVGILATDGTIKSKIYETSFAKKGIKTITPKDTQKSVMSFIYDVIKSGRYEKGPGLMFETVEELKSMGATTILLGCTELSSADFIFKFKDDFINPIGILADKSIKFAGGQLI
nr:amino acid racemase [Sedimentibacter sp.]